jgi:hypothetical protein
MVGKGMVGKGMVGKGMVGRGMVGRGMVGRGMVGKGMVGKGMVGEGMVGEGMVVEGVVGEDQATLGILKRRILSPLFQRTFCFRSTGKGFSSAGGLPKIDNSGSRDEAVILRLK